MPYHYRVTFKKTPRATISVEAWPKDLSLALPHERSKPSFIIGRLRGTRTLMLWHQVHQLSKQYGTSMKKKLTRIDFPDEIPAIADAYRLGLAAAALSHIRSGYAAEHALQYITRATQEEIWFWASKYIGVVDEGIKAKQVVKALCTLAT